MSKFDQQMREVERSLAQLTGNKAQAAGVALPPNMREHGA